MLAAPTARWRSTTSARRGLRPCWPSQQSEQAQFYAQRAAGELLGSHPPGTGDARGHPSPTRCALVRAAPAPATTGLLLDRLHVSAKMYPGPRRPASGEPRIVRLLTEAQPAPRRKIARVCPLAQRIERAPSLRGSCYAQGDPGRDHHGEIRALSVSAAEGSNPRPTTWIGDSLRTIAFAPNWTTIRLRSPSGERPIEVPLSQLTISRSCLRLSSLYVRREYFLRWAA